MQLDFQRYECKYVIPVTARDLIRDYVSAWAEPDTYSARSPSRDYLVTSLYLDSQDLHCHKAKENKDLNRFKLRIRCYDPDGNGPVFFEIKRKIKGVIHKRRVMVRWPDWAERMERGEPLHDAQSTERDRQVLDEFLCLKETIGAFPCVLVRYSREAFQGLVDDYSRVTFDYRLLCQTPLGYSLGQGRSGWIAIDYPTLVERDDSGLVLEVKFADRAPVWMVDLVDRFMLRQRGFSKYSNAVEYALGRYRVEHDTRLPIVRSR